VLGLEGASFAPGEELTPAVEAALEPLVAAVLAELGEVPCTSAP
jgi:hypothetical protein